MVNSPVGNRCRSTLDPEPRVEGQFADKAVIVTDAAGKRGQRRTAA